MTKQQTLSQYPYNNSQSQAGIARSHGHIITLTAGTE